MAVLLQEWPEAQNIPPVVDDLMPNPWGPNTIDNLQGIENFAQKLPGSDQIENAIRANFNQIGQKKLKRGDLITWHGTLRFRFQGYLPQDYQFVTHAGIYLGSVDI
jgi:cell wall-associated NlpC family hydrolase